MDGYWEADGLFGAELEYSEGADRFVREADRILGLFLGYCNI